MLITLKKVPGARQPNLTELGMTILRLQEESSTPWLCPPFPAGHRWQLRGKGEGIHLEKLPPNDQEVGRNSLCKAS